MKTAVSVFSSHVLVIVVFIRGGVKIRVKTGLRSKTGAYGLTLGTKLRNSSTGWVDRFRGLRQALEF